MAQKRAPGPYVIHGGEPPPGDGVYEADGRGETHVWSELGHSGGAWESMSRAILLDPKGRGRSDRRGLKRHTGANMLEHASSLKKVTIHE